MKYSWLKSIRRSSLLCLFLFCATFAFAQTSMEKAFLTSNKDLGGDVTLTEMHGKLLLWRTTGSSLRAHTA
jgi:hypothetical protein